MSAEGNILERWKISVAELTDILSSHPRASGMMGGYVARYKLAALLSSNPEYDGVGDVKVPTSGGRKAELLSVVYKGEVVTVRVTSLDTPGKAKNRVSPYVFQCGGSDKRKVQLRDGMEVQTAKSPYGEYDIVAVSLLPVLNSWKFAFCISDDLEPSSEGRTLVAKQLINNVQKVHLPLRAPYRGDMFGLVQKIVEKRRGGGRASKKRSDI